MNFKEWESFREGIWEKEINVRDFIQKNYTPYDGDESFLQGPTQATKDLWAQVMDLSAQEREKAVSWIWIPKSYPPSPLTVPVTWIKRKKPL